MAKSKKSVLVFLGVSILLCMVSFFAVKDLEFSSIIKYLILAVLVFFSFLIGYLFSKGADNKENRKYLDLIIKDGNPKAFLKEYEKFIKPNIKKSKNNSVTKTTYSLGLIADGQYEKAISYLSESVLPGNSKSELKVNRVIYNYLCSAYGNLGDFEAGKKYLEHLKNTNQDIKENKLIPNEFESVIEFYEYFLGDFSLEESIAYFEDYFKTKALTRYNKIMVKNKLALLYKEKGDLEKFNEYMDFVERYGKGLYVAVKARKLINENLAEEN